MKKEAVDAAFEEFKKRHYITMTEQIKMKPGDYAKVFKESVLREGFEKDVLPCIEAALKVIDESERQ